MAFRTGSLRRTWLALIAVGTIFFAFGSFTDALACATSIPVASNSGGGEKPGFDDCLAVCNTLCSAAIGAAPAAPAIGPLPLLPAIVQRRSLDGIRSGPDPPPPRA